MGACGHVCCDECLCTIRTQDGVRKCPLCRTPVFWCCKWDDPTTVFCFEVSDDLVEQFADELCKPVMNANVAAHAAAARVFRGNMSRPLLLHLIAIAPRYPKTVFQWVKTTFINTTAVRLGLAVEWASVFVDLLQQVDTAKAAACVLKKLCLGFKLATASSEEWPRALDLVRVVGVLGRFSDPGFTLTVLESFVNLPVSFTQKNMSVAAVELLKFEARFTTAERFLVLKILCEVQEWTDDGVEAVLPFLTTVCCVNNSALRFTLKAAGNILESTVDLTPVRHWLVAVAPLIVQWHPSLRSLRLFTDTITQYATCCVVPEFVAWCVKLIAGVLDQVFDNQPDFVGVVYHLAALVRHKIWNSERCKKDTLLCDELRLLLPVVTTMWRRFEVPEVDFACLELFWVASKCFGDSDTPLFPGGLAVCLAKYVTRNSCSAASRSVAGIIGVAVISDRFRASIIDKYWLLFDLAVSSKAGVDAITANSAPVARALKVIFEREAGRPEVVQMCAVTLNRLVHASDMSVCSYGTYRDKPGFELMVAAVVAGLKAGVLEAQPCLLDTCLCLCKAGLPPASSSSPVLRDMLLPIYPALSECGPATATDFSQRLGITNTWKLLMHNHDDDLLSWALDLLGDQAPFSPASFFAAEVGPWLFGGGGHSVWARVQRVLGETSARCAREIVSALKCLREFLKWGGCTPCAEATCCVLSRTLDTWKHYAKVGALIVDTIRIAQLNKVDTMHVEASKILWVLKAHTEDEECVVGCVTLLHQCVETKQLSISAVKDVHDAVWAMLNAQKLDSAAVACTRLLRTTSKRLADEGPVPTGADETFFETECSSDDKDTID